MIKGVNHTIIEVTNPENRYFERALLFVRPCLDDLPQKQLQQQADFFVQTVGCPPMKRQERELIRRNRKIKRMICAAFWWLTGLACGIGLAMLV